MLAYDSSGGGRGDQFSPLLLLICLLIPFFALEMERRLLRLARYRARRQIRSAKVRARPSAPEASEKGKAA